MRIKFFKLFPFCMLKCHKIVILPRAHTSETREHTRLEVKNYKDKIKKLFMESTSGSTLGQMVQSTHLPYERSMVQKDHVQELP